MTDFPLDPLIRVMDRLLGPDGCPWDKEQDHRSLAPYVVEEALEVVAAIDGGDPAKLKDELGDLLLQVVFHAALAAREGAFDVSDVVAAITEKLIRRHPHVFGGAQADTPTAVLRQWEAIKREEQGAHELGPGAEAAKPRAAAARPGTAPGRVGPADADPAAMARNTRALEILLSIARRRGPAEEAALKAAMAGLLARPGWN